MRNINISHYWCRVMSEIFKKKTKLVLPQFNSLSYYNIKDDMSIDIRQFVSVVNVIHFSCIGIFLSVKF